LPSGHCQDIHDRKCCSTPAFFFSIEETILPNHAHPERLILRCGMTSLPADVSKPLHATAIVLMIKVAVGWPILALADKKLFRIVESRGGAVE
jgi:hypothetical protein